MITSYGSGTATTPSSASPSLASADITCALPTSFNANGFQDYTRSGINIFKSSVLAGQTATTADLAFKTNQRGHILDIVGVYDSVLSETGIEVFASYMVSGSGYSTPELMATLTGRLIISRLFVEFRVSQISNVRYSLQNLDSSNDCKALNITASAYR